MQVEEARLVSPVAPPNSAPAAALPALRLWPAVTVVSLWWAFSLVSPAIELTTFVRFLSRIAVTALAILLFSVWWWTNRRIRLRDRALLFLGVVVGAIVVGQFCDPSVGGWGLFFFAVPVVLTVWTAWMLLAKAASFRPQPGLLLAVTLTWLCFAFIRTDGLSGEQHTDVRWRWSKTAEEQFLAELAERDDHPESAALRSQSVVSLRPGDWPGFRGPNRDSVVQGGRIRTDWDTAPPRQVWRHRVGPAWSSLAVVGDRLFTQEQRGEQEAVVCYDAGTGKQVWAHEDRVRFWEAVAAAGPRATPTFAGGRLFTLGATGLLNCLDAASGKLLWSRDVAADAGVKPPLWGFAGSPLVLQGVVVVHAGGKGDKGLLGYDVESGKPAWTAAAGGPCYSSPQPATVGGKPLVLFFGDQGLTAFDPATGAVLWAHAASAPGAPRSIQPRLLGETGFLIASETDLGLVRGDLVREGSTPSTAQRWASRDLKPSFNDFVIHREHVYGFDGAIFGCVDVETGERAWKGGRYGHGQVLLLADQSLLLVLSETGKAILLAADPTARKELGRFQALSGKTWNHPAIVRDQLYVRNGEEMACYDLHEKR
jgi:outer membrane protein assembly factor BamB